jgi:protease-4
MPTPTDRETTRQDPTPWERALLEKYLMSAVTEARRARRWGLFFRGLLLVYLVAVLGIWLIGYTPSSHLHTGKHTALVEVKGLISSETDANAEDVIEALRDAFGDKNTKGVIVRINSPGGSPVQSALINEEIRRLGEKHEKTPVYAVVEDLAASGGYYIAVAADKVYVNRSSILGSIGVLMNGFGFVSALEKLGVERRLMTAGEHKGLLDPFSPVKDFDREHLQRVLDQLHHQFIDTVKAGRGNRLKESPDLFSGLFWSGDEAVDLGLADAFGDVRYVAREVIGAEDVVDFTTEKDLWDRLAARVGTTLGDALARGLGLGSHPLELR